MSKVWLKYWLNQELTRARMAEAKVTDDVQLEGAGAAAAEEAASALEKAIRKGPNYVGFEKENWVPPPNDMDLKDVIDGWYADKNLLNEGYYNSFDDAENELLPNMENGPLKTAYSLMNDLAIALMMGIISTPAMIIGVLYPGTNFTDAGLYGRVGCVLLLNLCVVPINQWWCYVCHADGKLF